MDRWMCSPYILKQRYNLMEKKKLLKFKNINYPCTLYCSSLSGIHITRGSIYETRMRLYRRALNDHIDPQVLISHLNKIQCYIYSKYGGQAINNAIESGVYTIGDIAFYLKISERRASQMIKSGIINVGFNQIDISKSILKVRGIIDTSFQHFTRHPHRDHNEVVSKERSGWYGVTDMKLGKYKPMTVINCHAFDVLDYYKKAFPIIRKRVAKKYKFATKKELLNKIVSLGMESQIQSLYKKEIKKTNKSRITWFSSLFH